MTIFFLLLWPRPGQRIFLHIFFCEVDCFLVYSLRILLFWNSWLCNIISSLSLAYIVSCLSCSMSLKTKALGYQRLIDIQGWSWLQISHTSLDSWSSSSFSLFWLLRISLTLLIDQPFIYKNFFKNLVSIFKVFFLGIKKIFW